MFARLLITELVKALALLLNFNVRQSPLVRNPMVEWLPPLIIMGRACGGRGLLTGDGDLNH